ncbi:unnamed protein product [Prorocentrum cordatum]|uniref:Uncharacterized protein n=1 Tax=Prorocentrum cordatum TaxID=2364126 RepID=A0ABN9SWZ5_9DINO|nr:unnamed protein product [Polarella glacialis]
MESALMKEVAFTAASASSAVCADSAEVVGPDSWSRFLGPRVCKRPRHASTGPSCTTYPVPPARAGPERRSHSPLRDGGEAGDRCKTWIRGFTRKLPSRVFVNHCELLKAAAGSLLDGAVPQRESYKYCYNIHFQSVEAARTFFS